MSKLQLSLLLGIFFICPLGLCAQFQLHPDSSFYTFLDSFYTYHQDDSTEGGIYNRVRRDVMTWGTRLAPNGNMSKATQAMINYAGAYKNMGGLASATGMVLPSTYSPSVAWRELGPLTKPIDHRHTGMGQIHRIAFHPQYNGSSNQTLYAGSHFGGLYRSDNGGDNWYNYHTDRGLPITSIGGIAVSDNYVFVCTGNGDYGYANYGLSANYEPLSNRLNNYNPLHTQGVYYNMDGTNTWQSMNGSSVTMIDSSIKSSLLEVFQNGGTMRNIIVHPNNDNLLFIATSQGIFRTSNRGQTWQQVLVGAANPAGGYFLDTEWRGLEFNPLDPSILYASGKEVYRSNDGGLTWTSLNITPTAGNNAIKRINIALSSADTSKLYAYSVSQTLSQTGIYLYENGNWAFLSNLASNAACYNAIAVAPSDATVVHIGGIKIQGIKNLPTGITTANGVSLHDDVHALEYPPNNDSVLFLGNHGGVEITGRYSNVTTRKYTGLGVATIWSFDDWEGNDSVVVLALQDNGIFHTMDYSNTWQGSIRKEDGYGVRLDDHTGTAYAKFNDYAGLYDVTIPLRKKAEFNPTNTSAFIPSDDGRVGSPPTRIPNTFPMLNHPKNEKAYVGFAELYQRRVETYRYDAANNLPTIDSVLQAKYVYAGPNDSFNVISVTSALTCAGLGGVVVGIAPNFTPHSVLVWGWTRDTICRMISEQTYYDFTAPLQSDLKKHQASRWDRRIMEMAFSEDDSTNYTYLATLGDNNFNRRCDFYVNDANSMGCDTCFDIKTINIPVDPSSTTGDPNPITGIAVDPLNGRRVWISLSGYGNAYKVYYSADAGDSWTNWDDADGSLATLNLPINGIVYQRGTNDRLYIATDAGVYVREGQGNWLRYGASFPNVRVTELKINYCVGKLRAATFGRGVWEADLLPAEDNRSFRSFRSVDTSETWNRDKNMSRDIRIKSGATLTLQNTTLNMPKGGLIVVEQGAQLIVDSSTITNLCGQTWQGIEVWGTTSLEQHPNTNQGELILVNSQIAHAKEAVSPWQVGNFPRPDGTGGTGGIVRAINSTFYNNWRSVGFMQYQSPSGTYAEASNFIHCQFVVDSSLRQGFLGHVSAWDVANVRFKGCTFADNRPQKSGEAYGIYSLSASVQLTAQPPSPFNSNFKRNKFEGLARAIELGSDPTRFSSVVDQSDFDANGKGILVRADAGVKLIRNQFALGGYSNTPEYGIGLLRQGDFVVQQNTFTKSNQADAFDVSIGLWISDTKSGYNQVRNNSFVGIPIANLVHGDNGASLNDPFAGLQYLCNGQTGNAFDLSLKQSSQLAIGTSIAPSQGDFRQPARNSFSYPLDGNYFADWHLWNDGSGMNEVIYWIPPNAVQVEEPTDTLRVKNLIASIFGDPTFCNDKYPNLYVFKPQEVNTTIPLSVLKNNYYQAASQYQGLISTASTQADSSEVASIGQQVAYYANEVVFYYKNDTTAANWDSLTVWLGKIPGLMAQYDLVEHYWKQGLYTQAFNQLDHIQNNYELVGVVYENHRAYRSLKNILQTAYEENRNEALLDQEEVDQLRAIADNNYGFAAVYAANIVNFFYNYEYQYNPTLPTALQEKRNFVEEKPRTSNLVIYPNPSHTWAEVAYQLPEGQEEGLLKIMSTNGQMLQEIPIYQSNGKLVLSTKKWTAGIYFVALYGNKELIEQTTLVVKK